MAITIRNFSKNYSSYSVYKNPKLANLKINENDIASKFFNVTDFKTSLLKFKSQNPTITDNYYSGQSLENSNSASKYVDVEEMAQSLLSYSRTGSNRFYLPFLSSSTFSLYSKNNLNDYKFKPTSRSGDYTTKQLTTKQDKVSHFLKFEDMYFTSAASGKSMDTVA